MKLLPLALTLAFPGLLSLLHAEPGVIWSLPAVLKEDPHYKLQSQRIALQWINNEEIVTMRRGGVIGRYHCGKKATIWENKFAFVVRGSAISADALYLVVETPNYEGTLSRFALSDGMLQASHSKKELEGIFRTEGFEPGELAWLPKPKVLAIEASGQEGGSIAWFFDPESRSFKGNVNMGNTFSKCAGGLRVDRDELFWENAGVIKGARAGALKPQMIWDSGVGAGGDDAACLTDYRVCADGSFLAVLDNGGWARGCRIFRRNKPGDDVVMTSILTDVRSIAIAADLKMIYGTVDDDHFSMFDASGHLVKSIAHVAGQIIAISPSGKLAAVLDYLGKVTFLALE